MFRRRFNISSGISPEAFPSPSFDQPYSLYSSVFLFLLLFLSLFVSVLFFVAEFPSLGWFMSRGGPRVHKYFLRSTVDCVNSARRMVRIGLPSSRSLCRVAMYPSEGGRSLSELLEMSRTLSSFSSPTAAGREVNWLSCTCSSKSEC